VVILSRDHVSVAAFLFEDTLRPGAKKTVRALFERGMPSTLLSGDREGVVGRLASGLGIAEWRGALDPMQKAQAVREMSAAGEKVLMVGDGINDAPALRTAHVSIAPSTAADIGRQAADFVFMREGLDAVELAVDVSRGAGRLIRQNFVLAIGYNVIAVPVAILGYATPLIAAIAMSTSSMVVVANSLRLNARRSRVDSEPLVVQSTMETVTS
jgi:Cu2+-exporting ATPase